MSLFKSMEISASGLAVQRLRMNILSGNLANAQTTRTPASEGGGPYKRRDIVITAQPMGNPFEDFLDDTQFTQLKKVRTLDVHRDPRPPREQFEPGHPDADKNGYVRYPNINIMTEMVNMIAATRAYEANTTALQDTKQMAMKALEIGR